VSSSTRKNRSGVEVHTAPRKNYPRRAIGLLVVFGPVALAVASGFGSLGRAHAARMTVGGFALALALVVAAANFYLSFVRTALYHRRHGSFEGQRNISAVPLFGTVFGLLGSALGFGSLACAVMALTVLLVDTGGLPWFVFWTWKDASFWDDAVAPSDESS
jgi:hypothetical protein